MGGTLIALLISGVVFVQGEDEVVVRVALDTLHGRITLEVYPERAPVSAGDFLAYVEQGLYDGAAFYRAVRVDNDRGIPNIEVIQGGAIGTKQRLDSVIHETTKQTGLRHTDGAVSLARAAVGTGSAAAFFIVIGEQPALDYGGMRNEDGEGFAVFGRVVDGMDVVRRIQTLPTDPAKGGSYMRDQILVDPVSFHAVRLIPIE